MAKRKKSAIVTVKLRIREDLRAQIERAARARSISMNFLIGDVLNDHFFFRERLEPFLKKTAIEAMELVYGAQLTGVLLAIGDAMAHAGRDAALRTWRGEDRTVTSAEDPLRNFPNNAYALGVAVEAGAVVLEAFAKLGNPEPPLDMPVPPGASPEYPAHQVLREAATGKSDDPDRNERARLLNQLLGPIANQLPGANQ